MLLEFSQGARRRGGNLSEVSLLGQPRAIGEVSQTVKRATLQSFGVILLRLCLSEVALLSFLRQVLKLYR